MLYLKLIKSGCFLPAVFLVVYSSSVNAVGLKTGVDDQAQLPFWETSTTGMSLRFVQRLPVQTRAYFMARGFKPEHAELIAQSCVFQTVFKNISHADKTTVPSKLEYNLLDWVVTSKGTKSRPKTRQDWAKEWQIAKVKKSAQIAFEWSLYPTRQEYKPSDYNWGMMIFNLKPGAIFDLEISWQQYGKVNKSTIKGIQCAPDINPQPKDTE
ncbi:MAG: hypothetical protein GXP13_08850 [Gammaproteobacteria bacterium]|nr:hypothetical protein [Gammaproteobacteria bacterium]